MYPIPGAASTNGARQSSPGCRMRSIRRAPKELLGARPSRPQKSRRDSGAAGSSLRIGSTMGGLEAVRAPIEAVDSIRTQWRYKASIIAVAAYQRHGCSQSGSRLIVWPQARQRNLRIQMRIHPVSTNPQTWREYMPWPTIWSLPLALRAACPQTVQ